jgi:hypothetical protein
VRVRIFPAEVQHGVNFADHVLSLNTPSLDCTGK